MAKQLAIQHPHATLLSDMILFHKLNFPTRKPYLCAGNGLILMCQFHHKHIQQKAVANYGFLLCVHAVEQGHTFVFITSDEVSYTFLLFQRNRPPLGCAFPRHREIKHEICNDSTRIFTTSTVEFVAREGKDEKLHISAPCCLPYSGFCSCCTGRERER